MAENLNDLPECIPHSLEEGEYEKQTADELREKVKKLKEENAKLQKLLNNQVVAGKF